VCLVVCNLFVGDVNFVSFLFLSFLIELDGALRTVLWCAERLCLVLVLVPPFITFPLYHPVRLRIFLPVFSLNFFQLRSVRPVF
jgi:hypothetical protein